MANNWEVPNFFREQINEISLEYYKIVFEQSETILKSKIENGDIITTRAFTLAGIAAPAMTLSIGFFVGYSSSDQFFKVASAIEALICFVSIAILVPIILKRNSYQPGASPRKLFKEEWVSPYLDETTSNELPVKVLYLQLACTNDFRISESERQNRLRIRNVDISLLLLCVSPALSAGLTYLAGCFHLFDNQALN